MPSIVDLDHCAPTHLAAYADPTERRAFASYDRVGVDPNTLEPVDFFAPALLDAPVRGVDVRRMFLPDGPHRELRDTMERLLLNEEAAKARFEELDLTAETGPWALVRAVLIASDRTPGIKASKVTKILHRKRPALVPIFDQRVAHFYGCTPRRPSEFWPILHADLNEHGTWLSSIVRDLRTPDHRVVTTLRALDIIVWEHVTTGHVTSAAST
ncbi:MAG: DUF6308 family protein [Dermatophilaceae bacterium]